MPGRAGPRSTRKDEEVIQLQKVYVIAALCAIAALALACAPASATTYGSHYGIVGAWAGEPFDSLARDLGTKWIRTGFDWDVVETADNYYDPYSVWLQDNMFNTMTGFGINVFHNFNYTPAWARTGPTNAYPPTNPAKYTEYITYTVNRYKNIVHHWGLWNEPNLSQFYNGDFNWYINNLLIPGIDAIKAEDPTARVCIGELSTSGDDVGKLRTILQTVNAAGRKPLVDVVCHHSYDGGDTWQGRVADIDTLHNMIVSEGWGDKEFWITESSLETTNETAQANYLIGMVTAMDARPWWNKFFWWQLHEGEGGHFGLVRWPDWSLKPAYTQYQAYIAEHADDAEIVSDTIPTSMIAGQQYNVSVTTENTGTVNWTSDVYKLGAVNDSDPFYGNRVNLNGGEVIAPDQTKTFSFTMTAPTSTGTYTTDWRMVHEGVRWFGHSLVKTVQVTGGGQTPYAGVIQLPGTIQAENFDNGGEGVAYHDYDTINSGGQYRSTGVDIETCYDTGGGYNTGWMSSTEWLEWTVNVAGTGDYDIYLRVASGEGGGTFKVLLDGVDKTGSRSFAGAGGWQNWTTIIVPARNLTSGQHVFRVNVESGGWNLNKIDVISRGADAVSIDLGNPDINDSMTHISAGDGDTVPWTSAGHYCRENVDYPDLYMYFTVSDAWAYQGSKQNVYITFDYYDLGSGTLGLNYDAVGNQWKYVAGPALTNTGGWKQYTFNVTDAYFGNRENYGADFRICGIWGEWGVDTVCVYQ